MSWRFSPPERPRGGRGADDNRLARCLPRRSRPDLCRSYLLFTLHANDLAAPYLDAYRRLGDVSREAALAWLPYVAAARLAEEVPGEIDGLRQLLTLTAKPSGRRVLDAG